MEKPVSLPFYLKISQIIIGLVAFFYILYMGQAIILPLIFAVVIAILLNPFVNFLHRKGFNRVIAILTIVTFAFILMVGLFYFLFAQASTFTETLPQLKIKFSILYQEIIHWISHTFHVSTRNVDEWIVEQKSESLSGSSAVIGQTLTTISGMFVTVFLVPVYIFMFLFYKSLLLQFIGSLFPPARHKAVEEVLTETKSLIQSYLIGLLAEAAIVAILNSTGLLIIGIDYAILLGVIGALLNVIPYIGGVIAISLPMIIAIATKSPAAALWVFAVYIVVQLIDNNFIVPYVVASRVKINALVSIVVVLVGGALWGIPGMFLSIPLTAILKVIFDRVDPLKPLGFLLGDSMPAIGNNIFNFRKRKVKKK